MPLGFFCLLLFVAVRSALRVLCVLGASLCITGDLGEQSHWPQGDHFPACASQTVSGVLWGWDRMGGCCGMLLWECCLGSYCSGA